MKKIKSILSILTLAVLVATSCTRVNAGYEGIKVNLYGNDKGVDDVTLVTGMVWYNPFTEEVYEYPTFVQTVDYPLFEVNSKDGSKFSVDPSMLIKVEDGMSAKVFVKYRKDIADIIEHTLYVHIKDAARIEFNNYTADEIVSNRSAVDKSFEDRVREVLAKENFVLEALTPGIAYPDSYERAINAKNQAIQDKLRVDNEILVAKAEAEKILVTARAEAEANKLRTQALTPQVLEQMWIDKWDGHLPQYGSVPTLFKDITK